MKTQRAMKTKHHKRRALFYVATQHIAACFMICSSVAESLDEYPDLEMLAAGEGSTYLPDYSYAGYRNGLAPIEPNYGKVFSVKKYGAEPDDDIDDTKAVQRAIEVAKKHDGPATLRFDAGRYILTDILKIDRSRFIIQGAGGGEGGTTLYFPRPLAMVDDKSALDEIREYLIKYDKRQREKAKNLDVLFSEYSWTGGFLWIARQNARPAPYLETHDPDISKLTDIESGNRGGRTIVVDDPASLEVGDVLQVHWFNRDGENSPLISAIYDGADIAVGSHHWSFPDRPLVRQTTKVTAINGNTVSISDPLLHDINELLPAQLSVWAHLEEIGIEDIRLEFPNAPEFGHHVERGYNGIYLTSSFDSWIRNVSITNADSGILTYDSANVTIKNIRTDGARKAHYTVHIGNVHNVLVYELTVFNPSRHTLSFNTQSTRSVYTRSVLYNDPVLDQHAGSNHQNLFDDVTVFITPQKEEGAWQYALFDGSGAGYWQPGHGAFNASWNLNVIVEGGALSTEPVTLLGVDEGPSGRVIGVNGNRRFELDYRPEPFTAYINKSMGKRPSLYRWQLELRERDSLN